MSEKYLQILEKTLSKQSGWYTGIPLKKYIQKNYFDKSEADFVSQNFKTGRWSAYAHYSDLVAFQNLLDKHNLNQVQQILVHPLLPAEFIDILVARGYKLYFLDINKNTLVFESNQLQNYLLTSSCQLVVWYNQTGIYQELLDGLEIVNSMTVSSLIIADNSSINRLFFELVNRQKFGSFLWRAGDGFFDDHISEILQQNIQSKTWFYSWYLEDRLQVSPEYHLKQSSLNLKSLVESIFYLEMQKQPKTFATQIQQQLLQLKLQIPFKNKLEAVEFLRSNYQKLFDSAVPDFVFEFGLEEKTQHQQTSLQTQFAPLLNPSHFQNRAKYIYNQLSGLVATSPGELEIPSLKLSETPLSYFFYTTARDKYSQILASQNQKLSALSSLHPVVQNFNLPNTAFVCKYVLFVDLCS